MISPLSLRYIEPICHYVMKRRKKIKAKESNIRNNGKKSERSKIIRKKNFRNRGRVTETAAEKKFQGSERKIDT